jgi:hypothetical protein
MEDVKRDRKRLLVITAITILVAQLAGELKAYAQQPDRDLHDQAKKAGGKFVLRYLPDRSVIYPNVEELANRSDLIVVGRTLGNRARLRADGKFITKDFWVKLQEVIKGDLRNASTILVSLPGGSYMFEDKTYVLVSPRKYKTAEDNKTYVFFLKKKGTNYKGHELSGGIQGQFEITSGKVEPADLLDDPVVVKYKGMRAGTFLAQIHSAAGNTKKK